MILNHVLSFTFFPGTNVENTKLKNFNPYFFTTEGVVPLVTLNKDTRIKKNSFDLSKSLFNVKIEKSPTININEEGVSFERACNICEELLKEEEKLYRVDQESFKNLPPEDKALKTSNLHNDRKFYKELRSCYEQIGFRSVSNGDLFKIKLSAYKKSSTIPDEPQRCPRRNESSAQLVEGNVDNWVMRGEDKCCSFCGSLHPDRLIELVQKQGVGILESTNKSYKIYVNRKEVPNASFGGIKFYTQHFSDEQRQIFLSLLNDCD